MAPGPGIALMAIGLLFALFLEQTIGVILLIIGVVAMLLSFTMGWGGGRRDVIIERDRPVRRREVIRERDTY